jgi:hypothetical protein
VQASLDDLPALTAAMQGTSVVHHAAALFKLWG